MKIIKPEVELIFPKSDDYDNMLNDIVKAGRLCYKSEANLNRENNEKFIRQRLNQEHYSFMEHRSITVKITCDRGVTHELVRHRIASYTQESTRYCNYSQKKFGKEIYVIDIASGFKYDLNNVCDIEKHMEWIDAIGDAERHYMRLLELGATAQEARSVLPNSLKTEIIVTMNIREWRHFFYLRSDPVAHPQMREISNMILDMFAKYFPVFFEDIKKRFDE
jgi:thymidylate synthase (FAD)